MRGQVLADMPQGAGHTVRVGKREPNGLLRGARGTIAAKAGNSVDKSVLLAALLDASLVPYRLARGPLDDATKTALLGLAIAIVLGTHQLGNGLPEVCL